MLSAVMPIGFSVFSVGSVVFPASSFIRDKMGYSLPGWMLGCLVVVIVLVSASLHVEVSVKLVRVFLGVVTGFWSTFVLGGVV